MRKPYNFDSLALGWEIALKVYSDTPIGAQNVKQDPYSNLSSKDRTGDWATAAVGAVQTGSLSWVKVEESWEPYISENVEYLLVPTDASEDEDLLDIIDKALHASMFKAGNCTEMSALGLVQLCQWIASVPDDITIPPFKLKLFYGPDFIIEHTFLTIDFNDKYVLCDPWLRCVNEINDENLEAWKILFEMAECPPDEKKSVRTREQALIWAVFMAGLKMREGTDNVHFSVSSRETAKKIADLYSRSLDEAVLSLYNKELFDVKNMSSSLSWHEEPVHVYLIRCRQKKSLNYFERKNIKAIKQYLEQYEFPQVIKKSELLEHIHLYVYLFSNNNFKEKESTHRFVRLLKKSTYQEFCGSVNLAMDSLAGLKIYAAQVLARFDTAKNDKKAIALKKAWLSNNCLVDLCEALKMHSQPVNSLWTEINDWDAMPKELKQYVEKVLIHKSQNKKLS